MSKHLFFQYPTTLPLCPSRLNRCRRKSLINAAASAEVALSLNNERLISEAAIDAIRNAYTTANAAVHHGTCAHTLGRAAADLYDEARQSVARLINAADPCEIIFAPSITSATELFARSYATTLKRGDEIILTVNEPDLTRQVWASIATRYQLTIRFVNPDQTGEIPFEQLAPILSSRTRLVVLHAACPLIGAFIPLDDAFDLITGAGIPILLNGTHALQHTHVDVRRLRPDFLIADGTSIGAPHSAFLYGQQEHLQRMPPCFGGDEILEHFSLDADLTSPNWSAVPERFNVGMPSISCAAAIGAAADEIKGRMDDIYIQRSEQLARHLSFRLETCPNIILYGANAQKRIPVASFNVKGVDAYFVAGDLEKRGVSVEYGYHGARMAHSQHLGCSSSLRVVFDPERHPQQDIDSFVHALTLAVQVLS